MARPSMTLAAWRYYSRFFRGSHRVVPLSVASGVAQSIVLFPIAFLVRRVFDHALPARDFGLLTAIGLTVLTLYLISGVAALCTQYLTLRVTKRVTLHLREHLLQRIYGLSRTYLSSVDISEMHDSIVQNSQRVDVMTSAILAQFLPAALTSLVLGAVLLYLDPLLFLVMLSIGPVLLVVVKLTAARVIERIREFYESFARFTAGMLFVLQMVDLTRIQAAEPTELERQGAQFEDLRRTSTSMAWLQAVLGQMQSGVLAVSGVVILIVGGSAVALGHMSLGQLLSFYVVAALLQNYVGAMSLTVPQIIAGHASLLALYRMSRVEAPVPYSGAARIDFSGSVSLHSVTFGYGDRQVLTDVSLALRPGTLVAVVGPNGAGKSTIINLILGFYRPWAGHILADGQRLETVDVAQLRRGIGVVLQDPMIFSGTVHENITYGCPDAERSEVIRASRAATAHDFISGLADGYDTRVGERGMLLSGGQRQRIALARALLRRPALLLLDEPTNHLDAEATARLLANLRAEEPAPAVLIISHDMDVAGRCDEVHRLEHGRIVSSVVRGPSGLPRQEESA